VSAMEEVGKLVRLAEIRRYTDGREMCYEVCNGAGTITFHSESTLPDVIKMAMAVIDSNEDANIDPYIRKRPAYLNNVGWREYTEDMPDYDVYRVALTEKEYIEELLRL
jgi:hypothetical protein